MNKATFWAPLAAALFGILWMAGAMRPRSESSDEMQISKFARLPIQDGGRLKPVDTYARIHLMGMNRREEWYLETKDEKGNVERNRRPAVQWLLNLLAEGRTDIQSIMLVPPIAQEPLGLRPRRGNQYDVREIVQAAERKGPELKKLIEGGKDKQGEQQKNAVILMVLREAFSRREIVQKMDEARAKYGKPEEAKVFRIENDQVLEMLKLEKREGLRYSVSEFVGGPSFDQYRQKAISADTRRKQEKERDLLDTKVLELMDNLTTHFGLVRLDGLKIVPDLTKTPVEWETLQDSLRNNSAQVNPAAASMEKMIDAYASGDVKGFNKEVDSYTNVMNQRMPAAMSKVRLEAWFNQFAPFYQCAGLYVIVLLLTIGSWVIWHEPLRRAAFSLAIVVCVVHTLALIIRIYLTGRPPVTNLYSSAVFIGWGSVLLCLIVEWISWNRFAHSIALAVAAILGFATMIVAQHLGGSGDSMEVMQAVLDTNFWLATHVTTVTLGYTATFVAGFLASVYVFMMLASTVRSYFTDRKQLTRNEMAYFLLAVFGLVAIPGMLVVALIGGLWIMLSDGEPLSIGSIAVLSLPVIFAAGIYAALVVSKRLSNDFLHGPKNELPQIAYAVDTFALRQDLAKSLAGVVYGVICFATMLSFIGTVLGGIWADQSWGRFWGWDPKENGALLIVVMNALILHARWGGMIKERGMCVLAILGNMVTAWSWFGTNQLGVGLHAYGFNNTLAFGCAVFWVSQFGLAMIGLMPLRFWRAYADQALPPRQAQTPKGPRLQSGRGGTGIQPA